MKYLKFSLLGIIFLLVSCTPRVNNKEVYKIPRPDDGFGSFTKDIEITMNQDSTYILKALSNSSNIPVSLSMDLGRQQYGLASLGSKNINIAIDKKVGKTKFAGLLFDRKVSLNINMDSTIELGQENIIVKDYLNRVWISKKVKCENKVGIFLVLKDK